MHGLCVGAVVVLLLIAAAAIFAGRRKDGYLVYPYIDLDEPGERGSYYAMLACPGPVRARPSAARGGPRPKRDHHCSDEVGAFWEPWALPGETAYARWVDGE